MRPSKTRDLTHVAMFTALMCVLAYVFLHLPISPVAISAQTFGVMLADVYKRQFTTCANPKSPYDVHPKMVKGLSKHSYEVFRRVRIRITIWSYDSSLLPPELLPSPLLNQGKHSIHERFYLSGRAPPVYRTTYD